MKWRKQLVRSIEATHNLTANYQNNQVKHATIGEIEPQTDTKILTSFELNFNLRGTCRGGGILIGTLFQTNSKK